MLGTCWRVRIAVLLWAALAAVDAGAQEGSVTTYHGSPDRSGHFVVSGLTWERARSLHLQETFNPRVSGHVYAQPLYWRRPSGGGMLLVATEDNTVHAIDAGSGEEIWHRAVGRPVRHSSLRCGNIDPLGITGTPVIDPGDGSVYFDAAVEGPFGPRHLIFALSLEDGGVRPGWPVDVAESLRTKGQQFNARDQNERGALTIMDRTLYVPFGGHFGDCGDYHGWVVGTSLDDPRQIRSWATRARGGGIWAPGGMSVSGGSLFAATGNTFGASTFADGEAVFRLSPQLSRSNERRDFFAPADWHALDQRDADLGGTNPLPLDVGGPDRPQALILALGKDGKAYLLDRNDLGGIGGSLVADTVSRSAIRTSPAVYSVAGAAFVAFQGPGSRCPQGSRGNGLTTLKITAGSPPGLTTAWCADLRGAGSPIVTTSDGHSDPIVWVVGAEGDGRLHGYRGDNGEQLFSGGAMKGLHHFQTLLAADNRLFVAADGRIYAFTF